MNVNSIFHNMFDRYIGEEKTNFLLDKYLAYDRKANGRHVVSSDGVNAELLLIPLCGGTKVVLYLQQKGMGMVTSFEVVQKKTIINYCTIRTLFINEEAALMLHKSDGTIFVDLFLDDDYESIFFIIKNGELKSNSINARKKCRIKVASKKWENYVKYEAISLPIEQKKEICSIITAILEEKKSLNSGFEELKEILIKGENENDNTKLVS